MSDKTPGERAFEKFFETMAYPRPNLEWADSSPQYKAAWEAAAEEGHTAHIDRVTIRANALLAEYGNGFAVTHSKPAEAKPGEGGNAPKPGIDWLAINRSCS